MSFTGNPNFTWLNALNASIRTEMLVPLLRHAEVLRQRQVDVLRARAYRTRCAARCRRTVSVNVDAAGTPPAAASACEVSGSLTWAPMTDRSTIAGRLDSLKPSKSRSRATLESMTLNGVPEASLHDTRQLPPAEDLADQVGASREERQPIAAVEREPVRRVEAREPLGELLVRAVLVGVAGADERRLRRRVRLTC